MFRKLLVLFAFLPLVLTPISSSIDISSWWLPDTWPQTDNAVGLKVDYTGLAPRLSVSCAIYPTMGGPAQETFYSTTIPAAARTILTVAFPNTPGVAYYIGCTATDRLVSDTIWYVHRA